MSRLASVSLVLVCSFLALAPAADARGRLDPAFGERGVIDVSEDLNAGWLGPVAVAPDGGIYFIDQHSFCYRGSCPQTSRLRRYRPDGSLDGRFGATGRRVSSPTPESLLVDSAGRPLVAWEKRSGERARGIVIKRFRRNGVVDRSFGNDGTVFLSCHCYLGPLAMARGGDLLAAGYWEKRGPSGVRTKWFFARLRPSGERDRGFGRGGTAWLSMPAYYPPDRLVPRAGGGIFLGGFRPRGYDASAPYVLRLSGRGRIGARFARTTRRSLNGLYQTSRDSVGWEGLSLIPRSRGRIDVYGDAYKGGVVVRLLPDGNRDVSFGRRGVTLLPFSLNDAISDSSGGALAVGYQRGHYSVLRVGARGEVDRRFGRVRLPGAYNEYGLQIFSSGRGSAVVLARGESVCREGCPNEPKLFRILR